MAMPYELVRLKQAVEAFEARKPRDLPDGLTQALEGLNKELGRAAPEPTGSPGKRAAAESAYGGTGAPLSQAAKGPDRPSPGQKEFSPGQRAARGTVSSDIREAAARIVAEHQKS